jgi:hypothetical protein
MSHPEPLQRSLADAARGDVPSAPSADRSLPEFPQHVAPAAPTAHSPIEREIERSQRASAALAATRALARASFTDSQLAAEGATGDGDAEGDIDTANWVRTEYASLDQSVRAPQADVPHGGAPRNLVGAGFNPGMAFQDVRAFPGPSIAQTPIKTRSGAQARFLQESRQTPRTERSPGAAPRNEHSLSSGAGLYDKPAMIPMLATRGTASAARTAGAGTPKEARARASGEPFKFALAAGMGAVIALIGGGVAWKAGWLTHGGASVSAVTAEIATTAEAARVLSAAQHESAVAPPTVGTPSARTNEEVDAALAAAARAAAVPMASVHAAGPARVARPEPLPAPVAVASVAQKATPATVPVATLRSTAPAPATRGKDGVAAAIANAQARADTFLASGGAPSAAPATAPEVKKDE